MRVVGQQEKVVAEEYLLGLASLRPFSAELILTGREASISVTARVDSVHKIVAIRLDYTRAFLWIVNE